MSETEKVINDLNVAKRTLCNPQMLTPEMCVRIGQSVTNALALIREQQEQLKAQQPRLIPLEDLLDDAKAVFEVLWLERRDGNISPHRVYSNGPDSPYVHIMCFGGSTYALPKNEYLKEWRCWSQKPTSDQMDQTAWEAGTDGEGD